MTTTLLPALRPGAAVSTSRALVEKEALLARTSNAKKRNNIERLWAALEDMRTRKEQDFGVAAVAKAIERLGYQGPKYQSMRNKEGADFRALIAAYKEENGAPRALAGETDSADEDLPLGIADVRIQHRVRVVLRQNRALQERNRILHEHLTRVGAASAALQALPAAAVAASSLTADEVQSVKRFLERMESHGLRPDRETGCIIDRRSGQEIAPPYFLDALGRIAGCDSSHSG